MLESESRIRSIRRRIGRLRTSNYDVASRCNLHCEGCLFFAGDDYKKYVDQEDAGEWFAFFRRERERGVNFGYFAGAEPSLEVERLYAAHASIPRGVIFSNGLVKIPDDISYRIHVSLWGDDEMSRQLRGGGTQKAIRNYVRDPRATFVFTVTATNIQTIYEVCDHIADHGGRLTFNIFSPTTKYLQPLSVLDEDDKKYVRMNQSERGPVLGAEDMARATHEIFRALRSFPQTVIYSEQFHQWLARPEGLYTLDPLTGIATNCGNRLSSRHRHYNVDLSSTQAKCCSPNIDCSSCRAYAQSWGTYLSEHARAHGEGGQTEWLDVWDIWSNLFLGDDRDQAALPTTPARDVIHA